MSTFVQAERTGSGHEVEVTVVCGKYLTDIEVPKGTSEVLCFGKRGHFPVEQEFSLETCTSCGGEVMVLPGTTVNDCYQTWKGEYKHPQSIVRLA